MLNLRAQPGTANRFTLARWFNGRCAGAKRIGRAGNPHACAHVIASRKPRFRLRLNAG
jgi:hypothetical protein